MTSAYASQQAKRPNESAVAITDFMALSQRDNLCHDLIVGVGPVKQRAGIFHNDSREQQQHLPIRVQVLYSITKHAMRRSGDEIGATSISFSAESV